MLIENDKGEIGLLLMKKQRNSDKLTEFGPSSQVVSPVREENKQLLK